MAGLTPQMQQAIASAIQQEGSSGSYAQLAQNLVNDLSSAGLSSAQIQAFQNSPYIQQLMSNTGTLSNSGGGNTTAFESAADTALKNSLTQAQTNTQQAAGAASSPGSDQTSSGLPTSTAVTATAPAPVQDFGGIAQVSPQYVSAYTVDPTQSQSYMNTAYNQNAQALSSQFSSQDQSEADQLAARGLTSSGSGQYLTNQLYGQQASALAGADEPITAQGYGYSQQDLTGNAAAQNTAALTNASAANNAAYTNAGYYNAAVTGNASAYNNYLATLYNSGTGLSNSEFTAYLNSYQPSSGVTSALNEGLTGTLSGQNSAYTNLYDQQQNAENQDNQEISTAAAGGQGQGQGQGKSS